MRILNEFSELTVNQRVGWRLMTARKMRGMTAPELVERLSEYELTHPVSVNAVSRWETGKQPVPSDTLIAVMKILEVSPYYIMGDQSPVDDEDKKLHNIIQELPRKDKRILTLLYTKWKGCTHTLMEIGLMYACLAERVRKLAVRHLIRLFEKNRHEMDESAAEVDVQKVYEGMMNLGKKEKEYDK